MQDRPPPDAPTPPVPRPRVGPLLGTVVAVLAALLLVPPAVGAIGGGGDGTQLCSGDMLLEALVACAGVTLRAVATALEFDLAGGRVSAEGDLDFAGTLGVSKEVPVGFKAIRLRFDLETSEPQERIDTLTKLTERYCVVFQTLSAPPPMPLAIHGGA